MIRNWPLPVPPLCQAEEAQEAELEGEASAEEWDDAEQPDAESAAWDLGGSGDEAEEVGEESGEDGGPDAADEEGGAPKPSAKKTLLCVLCKTLSNKARCRQC